MTDLSRRSLLKGLLGAVGLAALARLVPAATTAPSLVGEVGRCESVRFITAPSKPLKASVLLADIQRVADTLRRNHARMIDDMYYKALVHKDYKWMLGDLPPKAGGLRFTKGGVEVDPRDYFGPDRVWYSVEEYTG